MATKRRAETAQENREKMIQAARKAFAEKGYAAAFGVLTADMVNFDYPGLSLSDQRFTYYNGTISAKFDKSTGNMVYAHYDYPVIIELTAHLLGSNTRVKVGMTTINDFTIKY